MFGAKTKTQQSILHYFTEKEPDTCNAFHSDPSLISALQNRPLPIHHSLSQLRLVRDSSFDFQREWDANFSKLCVFKKNSGHCNVPLKSSPLGRWVGIQRELRKCKEENLTSSYENPPITDDQIRKLDSVGFVWSLRIRQSWCDMYEQLLQYKMKHGNCDVPQNFFHNKPLGRWVGKQRQNKKKKLLHTSHIHALDQAGFKW